MASYDMAGKTAVVTGGTKGIGKAIALAFGQCGANVVVAGRHEDECTAVAEAITSAGGHGKDIRTDVRNIDEIDALIAGAAETFGGVDILINCAGVAITKKILDLDVEDYDMIMETNLRSVLFASKAAAAVMKASEKGGKIINIASVGGLKGTSALSLYGASKAGVINLTKTMALEWSRYGIQTNAVCPGYVVTEINKAEFENEKFSLMAHAYIEAIKMQLDAVKYYTELPDIYNSEWAAGYNMRAMLIPDFVDHYGLDVPEEEVTPFREDSGKTVSAAEEESSAMRYVSFSGVLSLLLGKPITL